MSNKTPGEQTPDAALESRAGETPLAASPKHYNHVVRSAELSVIQLVAAHFNVSPRYYKSSAEEGSLLERAYDCVVTNEILGESGAIAGAVFEWSLRVKREEEELLDLQCNYLVVYTGLGDCDKKAADAFVRRVGMYATYPYFRAFTSQINWAANADLPPLPVLREDNRPSGYRSSGPKEKAEQPKEKAEQPTKKKPVKPSKTRR